MMVGIIPKRRRAGLSMYMVLLTFGFFILFDVATVIATSRDDESSILKNQRPQQTCSSSRSSPQEGLILSINAANGYVDWERVNDLAPQIHENHNRHWRVEELVLEQFGPIMKEQSFHAALEYSLPVLESTIQSKQPDVLLVASKGVGVLAYLAAKNLWIDKPAILLSPIPNPIGGMVDGATYQSEWNDTIRILRAKLGPTQPLLMVVGSSSDEQLLITDAMEDTVCGSVMETTGEFEHCTNWLHLVMPDGADHTWKNLPKYQPVLAKIIEYVYTKSKRT